MGRSTCSLGARGRGGTFLVSAQSASISGRTVLAQVEQLPIIRFVHHLEYVVSEGELESELAVCTTKPMNEAEPRLCFDL